MALEIRYVGTLSRDLWQARNFNEVNIVENGFLDEFRAAQAKPAGEHRRPGRGASHVRVHRRAGHGAAADPARALQLAAVRECGQRRALHRHQLDQLDVPRPAGTAQPEPVRIRQRLLHGQRQRNRTDRQRDLPERRDCRRRAAQLLRRESGPDRRGVPHTQRGIHRLPLDAARTAPPSRAGAAVPDQLRVRQGDGSRASSAIASPLQSFRDVGTPGDLAHQFKANVVYDLPFGQGRRFMGGAGRGDGAARRRMAGWRQHARSRAAGSSISATCAWSAGRATMCRRAFKLRFDHEGKVIFIFPEDVVTTRSVHST